jgi:glucose/arabinose dehydrogenase
VRLGRYPAVVLLFSLAVLGGCSSEDEGDSQPPASTTKPASNEMPPAEGRGEDGEASARPVRLLRLGSRQFEEPTYLTAPRGDRRRFVVERGGRILVVKRGRVLGEPFLDISGDVMTGGESGLLSMVFAPDYADSGLFYVYYTDQQGYPTIAQFRRSQGNPDRADPSSRRTTMRVPHQRFNHKGGQVQFGPDGMLYAGFGDGGGGGDPDENAQNLGRILGKMVRIDPRPQGGYSVPGDNPFANRSGARREVYAYGLRNPYRFSFDRRTGGLTVGDVGQDAIEEIDYVPGRSGDPPRGGYNFGWDVFEGRESYEGGRARGHVPPVISHSQDGGFCSIIGGYVIRDRSLGRGWTGRYIYGDYCRPGIRLAALEQGGAASRWSGLRVPGLVSFGEDGRGRVYAVSLNGPVYRIGRR